MTNDVQGSCVGGGPWFWFWLWPVAIVIIAFLHFAYKVYRWV